MKRWQLTVGLTVTAGLAALLAPTLKARLWTPPPPPLLQDPPVVPEAETPAAVEQGRLVVQAGLDREAVLVGSPAERFLAITVRAPEAGGKAVRSPVNVAVVMDASGSMSAAGKITYAKDAAKTIVRSIEGDDTFSLVTFSDDASVIVPASPPSQSRRALHQIDRIYEGGGTNLYAGLHEATGEVERVLDAGEVGRLIVLSDGNANVGVTDPNRLAELAQQATKQGIAVSAMGLGVDYNEDLLAHIADLGGGTYDYIDDPGELASVFAAELERTSEVVVRNTSVSIDLPAGVTPIEVVGWDAIQTPTGWRVFLGDLSGGAERKIIARVQIEGAAEGALDVAQVHADYIDLLDGQADQSSDVAIARMTFDPNEVEGSLHAERSAAANRAWGNQFLQASTEAYANGQSARAESLLQEGSSVLWRAAEQTGVPELANDAAQLDEQQRVYRRHSPRSHDGRRAIKMSKEFVRGASR